MRIFIAWGLGAARITLWASLSHSSSLTKVRSGHWWYIKQTYQDNFINITTLLIPEVAHLELIFSGLRIVCWAATFLPDTKRNPITLATDHCTGKANTNPDTMEEEGELFLLAPDYFGVGPLCVILSMIIDCCL